MQPSKQWSIVNLLFQSVPHVHVNYLEIALGFDQTIFGMLENGDVIDVKVQMALQLSWKSLHSDAS